MQAHPPAPSIASTSIGAEIRSSDTLLRLLADVVPVMLAYFETTHQRCMFANQRYGGLTGRTPQDMLGKTVRELIGERAWLAIQPYIERALTGEAVKYTRPQTMSDGCEHMLETHLLPHFAERDGQQALVGTFVVINDISHHWESERAVRQSEERMRKFAAATDEAIMFHRGGVILDVNDATLRLTGFAFDEVIGQNMLLFVAPEHHDSVRDYTRRGREDAYEVAIRHKDGHHIPVEVVGKTMPQDGGDYRTVIMRDLRPHRQAQERETYLTLHDPLTQLPNRRHLLLRLARLLSGAQPQRYHVALLFIDLDHFKTVNESLGHEAGDRVLTEAAQRLQQGLRPADFIARVGGDQFVVVMPGIAVHEDTAALAQTVLERMHAPYAVQPSPLVLSIPPTIGISVFPHDGFDPDELLHHAEAAMHQAKREGRGTSLRYQPGMEGRPAELLQQEQLLREALVHEHLMLHYQPQVHARSGALAGFEALVRWQHPQRGLVGPDEFIPLAESRGLIAHIGRWVLRQASRQLKAWQDEGLAMVPMAVNVSALEFRQRDLVAEVSAVLQETGLEPRLLEIEITESALLQQAQQIHTTLQALRALGVSVTLDDFGTGYSSLTYLKRFPIDKLKIDRSFVADTPGDSDDVAIVTAIVQLARNLQLGCVAEGVETPAQLALLRDLDCTLVQGYLVARPMDAQHTRAWLLEREAAPAGT